MVTLPRCYCHKCSSWKSIFN